MKYFVIFVVLINVLLISDYVLCASKITIKGTKTD